MHNRAAPTNLTRILPLVAALALVTAPLLADQTFTLDSYGELTNGSLHNVDPDAVSGTLRLGQGNFSDDALVGYWRLDDDVAGDGGTVTDYSGNGNDGTTQNGVTTGVDGVRGSQAFSFDGSDDTVNVGTDLPQEAPLSVFGWMWIDSDHGSTEANVIGNYDGNGWIFRTRPDNSDEIELWFGNSGHGSSVNAVTERNEWVHLGATLTKDGKITYYKNGKIYESFTTDDNIISTTNAFRLASRGDSDTRNDLLGKLDEVRVYSRALTPHEAHQLYNPSPGYLSSHFLDAGSGENWFKVNWSETFEQGTDLEARVQSASEVVSDEIDHQSVGEESNPGQSCLDILQKRPSADSGTYWIDPDGSGGVAKIRTFCDMETDGGGWTLVTSNHYNDSTIPGGTNRQNTSYHVNRPGHTDPLISDTGAVGPNVDYIIGPAIDELEWHRVRVTGWGWDQTGNSDYSYTDGYVNKNSNWIRAEWTVSGDTGVSRLIENTPRNDLTVLQTSGMGLDSQAANFAVDGIKADQYSDGYDCNTNQCTIGGVGTQNTAGGVPDPGDGTYFGHGDTEGSGHNGEGWYDSSTTPADAHGWATWVRGTSSQTHLSNWTQSNHLNWAQWQGSSGQPLRPLSQWRFDEGEGQIAVDYAGGNNGILGSSTSSASDDPTWTEGCRYRGCLEFDGSDDYVSPENPNLGSGDFTLSGWFTLDEISVETGCCHKIIDRTEQFGDGGYTVRYDQNEHFTFFAGDGTNRISPDYSLTVQTDTWYHVAWVRRGQDFYGYVNGEQVVSRKDTSIGNLETNPSLMGDFTIGGMYDGTNEFLDGTIDDVRIYKRGLTSSEIQTLYHSPSQSWQPSSLQVRASQANPDDNSLVGSWSFEGTGQTVIDGSDEGNSGVLGANVSDSGNDPVRVSGYSGQGLHFDGENDHVVIGDTLFDGWDAFTVTSWIKPKADFGSNDAHGIGRGIVAKAGQGLDKSFPNGDDNFEFGINENGYLSAYLDDGSDVEVTGNTQLEPNQWYFVATTYDNNEFTVYLDGASDGTTSNTGTLLTDNHVLHFGDTHAVGESPFNGTIDEIKIYNNALPINEIQSLYNVSDFTPVIHDNWGERFSVNTTNNDGQDFDPQYYQYKVNLLTGDARSVPSVDQVTLANVSDWSEWQSDPSDSLIDVAENRFAQVQFNFSSDGPLNTSILDKVIATVNEEPWITQQQRYTNSSDSHAFDISAVGVDPDGASTIDGCTVLYTGPDGTERSTAGTLDTSYGNSSEAECSATLDHTMTGIGVSNQVEAEIRFTDRHGGTATTATDTNVLPNHPPVIVEGVQFTNYTDQHAFNVSAVAKDVDEGSGEITSCTVHHTDGESTYTTSGTLDTSYGTTDEAKCTLTIKAEVDGGFTGYQPTEDIDVWIEFTDKHGKGMGTWKYQRDVALTSTHGQDLENFPAQITLDTASLIDAGKIQPDCEDIRVYEDERLVQYNVTNCDSASTTIHFGTNVTADSTENDITVTYGHSFDSGQEERLPTRIINGKGELDSMAYWCSNIEADAPRGHDNFLSGTACDGINQSTSNDHRRSGYDGIDRAGNGDWDVGPVSGAPTIGEGDDVNTLSGSDQNEVGFSAFLAYSGNRDGIGLKGVKAPDGVHAHAWFHLHWVSSDQHRCDDNIWVGTLNETGCGGSERHDAGWFIGDGTVGPSGDYIKEHLLAGDTSSNGDWSTRSTITVNKGQWVYPFVQDTKWGGADSSLAQLDDFYWSNATGHEITLDKTLQPEHTVSNPLPNQKPVVEKRETFPSGPEFGDTVTSWINVTDQDDSVVWANFTAWEHNDESANRIFHNVNGTALYNDTYSTWNSTTYEADLENSTYNWSVTISDRWSTTETTGAFSLVEQRPEVSGVALRRPTPWDIAAERYRPGQATTGWFTVTDLNGRSDIDSFSANITSPDGLEASFLATETIEEVLNGYNVSVTYSIPDDAALGTWNVDAFGVDEKSDAPDLTGNNATPFTVEQFSTVTTTLDYSQAFDDAYIDGNDATPGIYTNLAFPYMIETDGSMLTGLIDYGRFQSLGFDETGSSTTVNLTQDLEDNTVLVPASEGSLTDLEQLEGQFTDGLFSGRGFLDNAEASIAYGVSEEKTVRVATSFQDDPGIFLTGFNGSLGRGVHTIAVRNAGTTNETTTVRVIR